MIAFLPVVGRDLVRSSSPAVFAVFMYGSVIIVAPFLYRRIEFNIEASAVLVVIEVMLVVAIAVGVSVASGDSRLSLVPLDPSRLPDAGELIPALILGVASFTGYDAISTLAEEARTPAKVIPKATLLALSLVGAFWILASTALSDAIAPTTYAHVIERGGFALGTAASVPFGTVGHTIIDVMALESGFALLIAYTVAATRIVYAMGRDAVVPDRLGAVHPRSRIPWAAVTAMLAFAVLADTVLSVFLGLSSDISLWLLNLIVFFALLTYIAVNVCNAVLYARHFRAEFRWFANGAVPLAGVAIVGYFLYKSFFEALWDSNFKTGKSVVLAAGGLVFAGIGAAWARCRSPQVREAVRSAGGEDF
jgi:amino acid transporter